MPVDKPDILFAYVLSLISAIALIVIPERARWRRDILDSLCRHCLRGIPFDHDGALGNAGLVVLEKTAKASYEHIIE